MEEYKVGDVVQLKSGGPKMTIKRFVGGANLSWQGKIHDEAIKTQGYKDGDLICVWFEHNVLKDAVFPAATVQKA